MLEVTTPIPTVIADPLDDRIRATWTDGDFGRIATSFETGAAAFITGLVRNGEQVLDVACGTGNTALPAARVGARVTALDIAPNLLAQLASQAAREGLGMQIDEGNCEALPYPADSFDAVISMFGAMFAARPDRVASELVRVCRPGGTIAMANWTRTGFVGSMLKTTVAFVPAPTDVPSPLLWGDEAIVRERIGAATSLTFNRRTMPFRFPVAPAQVVDLFREFYGPTKRAFDRLDTREQQGLHEALTKLWSEHNLARDGSTYVESEYLEVIANKA